MRHIAGYMALWGFQHGDYCDHCRRVSAAKPRLPYTWPYAPSVRTSGIDPDPQGSAHDWDESRVYGKKLDAVEAGSGQLA
jgi:hypothetical protein